MNDVLNLTNIFVTISNEMKSLYLRLFGKDSNIFFNTPDIKMYKTIKNGHFLYAGGLGLGRLKILLSLAYNIDKFNLLNGTNKELHIYTSSNPNEYVRMNNSLPLSLKIYKSVGLTRLNYLYNKYTYLVHVESFERKYINKTMYSISTKIPEYLFSGSKIIAIGDKNLSSIKFLKDNAFIIHDDKKISSSLITLFNMPETPPNINLQLIDSIINNKTNLLKKIKDLLVK
jgi:hypothetical protein